MRKVLAQLGVLLALSIGINAMPHAQSNRYSPEQINEMKQLANDGIPVAQAALGVVYLNGNGLPKNYEKAHYWLTLSSNQGYALADVHLGLIYLEGLGVNADKAKALEWFDKACSLGLESSCELYSRHASSP